MIMIINHNKKELKERNFNNEKLSTPNCLKVYISLFSKISIKKNCVEIRKINGNISYNSEGAFKVVNNIGVKKLVSDSLRKFASSIRLIIITSIKNMIETEKIFFINFFKRKSL